MCAVIHVQSEHLDVMCAVIYVWSDLLDLVYIYCVYVCSDTCADEIWMSCVQWSMCADIFWIWYTCVEWMCTVIRVRREHLDVMCAVIQVIYVCGYLLDVVYTC